jgi:hypothetical protein
MIVEFTLGKFSFSCREGHQQFDDVEVDGVVLVSSISKDPSMVFFWWWMPRSGSPGLEILIISSN